MKLTIRFDNNSIRPRFSLKRGRSICNDKCMFVCGYAEDSFELWKYNFSSKTWSQLVLPTNLLKELDTGLTGINYFDPNILLFFLRSCTLIFSYDIDTGTAEMITRRPQNGSEYNTAPFYCINGSEIYVGIIFESDEDLLSVRLYKFDSNSNEWNFVFAHKSSVKMHVWFDSIKIAAIHNDEKIFFFSTMRSRPLGEIFCYDLANKCSLRLPTSSNEDVDHDEEDADYFVLPYKDSVYFVGAPSIFSEEQNNKIMRFHFPSLTWSLLPLELPDSMIQCSPIITVDGQMHIFCENGMYQINLSIEPRRLQDICWDAIVSHPRSHPLSVYSDEELRNSRIPKIFRQKIQS